MYTPARTRQTRLLANALLCLLATLLLAPVADAFNYCVNTSSNFNSALILAAASPADDEIRLVQGTYTLTSTQSYDVAGDLSLRGGWNAGCTIQGLNPTDTTITSATPQANTLKLKYFTGSALIERLHFSQMGGLVVGEAGAYSSVIGEFRVQKNRFSGNNFGLSVNSSSHDVVVQNNLFLNNDGTSVGLSGINLYLSGGASNGAAIALDVTFNTITGGRLGTYIFGGASYRRAPRLQNNIVRNAANTDLILQNNIAVYASHNILGTRQLSDGATLTADVQNLDVDPQLAILSYVPMTGSPAANSGTYAISGGVPNSDYDGSARVIGIAPDRGAQESSIDNSASLVVSSTADSGAGSLRQALTSANLNPDFKKITFNIPGSCPQQINLNSALPAITKPVGIEGYTQAGSAVNNGSSSFDGTVCVFLVGGNSIASGLRLQTQSVDDEMSVRGLGFYGFSSQALLVSGPGKGSVRGNLFGTGLGLGGTAEFCRRSDSRDRRPRHANRYLRCRR
jgi:hypothetical protein